MEPNDALSLIRNDAEMQWELVAYDSDPALGSRPTEENYWSPSIEAGRKVRVSSAYPAFAESLYMRTTSEPLTRWEDSI